MKHSISNIALTPYNHDAELIELSRLGLTGLEVAPSRVWKDTWQGLGARSVDAYRKQVELSGLQVVGLHSLFFDHQELGLCKGTEIEKQTAAFLIHLSGVCRDLGGRTLIWGGGRNRSGASTALAIEETERLLNVALPVFERDGTCLCIEPLGPGDADFLNSVLDILSLVERYSSPAFRIQLDAKALVENDESSWTTFEAVQPFLIHFHANEPNLAILGESGKVPHAILAEHLRRISYNGFVSIEQRMIDAENPMESISDSMTVLRKHYKSWPPK